MRVAMLRGPTNRRPTTMYTIELRSHRPDGAVALRSALADLLDRLYARDGALDATRLKLRVVSDAIVPPEHGEGAAPPLLREDHSDGCTITLCAAYVEQALAGDADELMQLVHLLHRELWRSELARDATTAPPADSVAAQFWPIVTRMFDEYRANRASAWSLPARADLLLPHLLGLLEELPAACERALSAYRIDGDDHALAGLSMARLALLMQTTAFSLGYLAGLGRSVADIAPEMKAAIDASLLGREWPRFAALLAGAADSAGDARLLQLDMLRTRVMAVLSNMGVPVGVDESGHLRLDVSANWPVAADADRKKPH